MKAAQPERITSGRGGPLAIFVATAAELRPLRRALRPTFRSPHQSDSIWHVTLGDRELLLIRTGMGPKNAETAARRLFEQEPVKAALAVGLAAGLDPRLQTGDLIVGSDVTLHRVDGTASERFPCDVRLQESALTAIRQSGQRYFLGPIATAQRLVPTPDGKRRFAAESAAIAADMESAAIASVASARAIPFLAIRAILDPVNEDLTVTFDQFLDKQGEPRPLALMRYVITHPLAVPKLIDLGLRTKAACTRLGRLLRELSALPV